MAWFVSSLLFHIKNFLFFSESQSRYIQNIENDYTSDLESLLDENESELQEILKNAKEETDYLKTIIFRQDTVASKELRTQFENYMQKCYETEYGVRLSLLFVY